MVSWNINGVKTKLEKNCVQEFLLKYDIIGLNEVKTASSVSFPGYFTYRSAVRGSKERGGTVLLVKNYVSHLVAEIDTSIEEQIWGKLKCAPKILFGFCYIPPADSQYYSHESFACIQEKLKTSKWCEEYCIVGDMNARFGKSVRELSCQPELQQQFYSYPVLADQVQMPNENAVILLGICKEAKMLVLNNLKTPYKCFASDKTFKKGREWISELDTCVVSPSVVSKVCQFTVIHDEALPSDHAPITLEMSLPMVDMENLYTRACRLGEHLVGGTVKRDMTVKPISMCCINEGAFLTNLNASDVIVESDDLNVFANNVTDLFVSVCKS